MSGRRRCFPNGCCGFCKPPPQVQQQIDTTIHVKQVVGEKETRYGYIYIYPGVRTSEKTYTCPMLSVHLYHHSQHKADITHNNRTVMIDRKNEQVHQGPQQYKRAEKTSAEEEIIMIPVEDVTQISTKIEMTKGLQADVTSETKPVYALTENCCDRCYGKLRMCCRKTSDCLCGCCQEETKIAPVLVNTQVVINEDPNRSTNFLEEHLPIPEQKKGCCTCCRCWCCRKKKLVDLIRRTNTVAERQAERVITVTIEYSKYSHLDSASNVRLLSGEQQVAYYWNQFQPDTKLKFNLVNSTEFDSKNFEFKRQETETLCRTIMQLKAMRNHYPSDIELDQILDQPHKRTFGDLYTEPIIELPFDSMPRRIDFRPETLPPLPEPLTTDQ